MQVENENDLMSNETNAELILQCLTLPLVLGIEKMRFLISEKQIAMKAHPL